jgi:ADP-ribosylglycohydrolase
MTDNRRPMVMASFAADSLALGVHWIYDAEKIKQDFCRVDALRKPLPNSYHPTKEKGEFTHYGDQTFVLLESIAAKRGFDLSDFSTRWRDLFKTYRGYFDQATKMTLQNLAQVERSRKPAHPPRTSPVQQESLLWSFFITRIPKLS